VPATWRGCVWSLIFTRDGINGREKPKLGGRGKFCGRSVCRPGPATPVVVRDELVVFVGRWTGCDWRRTDSLLEIKPPSSRPGPQRVNSQRGARVPHSPSPPRGVLWGGLWGMARAQRPRGSLGCTEGLGAPRKAPAGPGLPPGVYRGPQRPPKATWGGSETALKAR